MNGVVLLTGATGFVGRQVLRELVERGVQVRVVVRNEKKFQLAPMDGIEKVIITPDLFVESVDWWADVCTGIDTVIHAAWYAEPGKYLHSTKNIECLTGTLHLARGAAQSGVRRFIGIGTCFEYDTSACMLSINSPLRPLTPYAGAKAGAFISLSQWLPLQNVEFSWCRLFYLYGEGEDERRLVAYVRKQLEKSELVELTSGTQIRDFLDVREAGRMIVDVALSGEQGPVNICSGVPITVRQLAEQIADEYGLRDLLKFCARPDNLVDPPCVVGVKREVIQ